MHLGGLPDSRKLNSIDMGVRHWGSGGLMVEWVHHCEKENIVWGASLDLCTGSKMENVSSQGQGGPYHVEL